MRRAPDRYRGRASSLWPLADPAEARSGRYRCLAEVRTDRGEQALFDPIGSILGERQVREVGLADWECRRSHAYVDHYREEAGQAGRPRSADCDRGSRSIRERLAIGKSHCLSALHFRKLCSCPRYRSSVSPLSGFHLSRRTRPSRTLHSARRTAGDRVRLPTWIQGLRD